MNKFEVVGILTKDPEIRYTKENKTVATVSLAVRNGKDDTTFLTVKAFGGTADIIQKYTHKGEMILVNGMIRNDNYTDKEGKKHYGYSFIANMVEFLSRPGEKREEPKEENNEDPLPDEAFAKFGESIDIPDSEIAF